MKTKLFGFIPVYGLLIACAIGMAVALCEKECRRKGLPADSGIDMALWAVPPAIVGARLYYVAFRWQIFASDPLSILRVWEGGLAIYGAVIGGFLGLLCMARIKKISFLTLLDIAAPVVLLGQAIGRWGNYFNGEAYGFAVTNAAFQFFPLSVFADGQWHLATFFYESCWNLIGFLLLWHDRKQAKKAGDVAFGYLLWYGAGRLFIEGLRTDSLLLLGMRVSQLLSLGMCVASCVLLSLRHKKHGFIACGAVFGVLAIACLLLQQTWLMLLPAAGFAGLCLAFERK